MCITAVALEAHPCFPFILVHTRDEDWDRATEPVQTHDDGNGNGALVFARDVQAGGTFLGLNLRTFGFGALTNIRSNVPRPDHTPSRGELVIRIVGPVLVVGAYAGPCSLVGIQLAPVRARGSARSGR